MSNALFREKWETADLFVEKLNRKKRNLSLKQRAGYDCIVQKVLSRLVSLTWAPTVQAGPASEKLRGKGYAFYHNKAPEYSDPLSAIARWVRLVLKSVGE